MRTRGLASPICLACSGGRCKNFDFPYRQKDGTEAVVEGFRLCYSLDAPHLELVNAVPGTPWEYNEYSNLHHIGYLVDDVEAASQHLASNACPLGGHGVVAGTWAYHEDQLGFRLEIIDAAGSASMGRRMLGGDRQFNASLSTSF